MTRNELNQVTERITGCAIEVHRSLGPGLLEATYEAAMAVVFEAQVWTYLKITGKPLGLLINFNSRLLKEGIKRFAGTTLLNDSPAKEFTL